MKKVEVRSSPIHGKGLFALEPIGTGELIGMYDGRIVPANYDEVDEGYGYVLWMEDKNGVFFGILGDGDTRYMNHQPDPLWPGGGGANAVLSEGGPYIHAKRSIKAGEEITADYLSDGDEED